MTVAASSLDNRKSVSLITTVLNDAPGTRMLLNSIPTLVRRPDEIIILDGGSTDGTVEVIQDAAAQNPNITLLSHPGVNIGRGRNIAIATATGELIASTDTGCRLDRNWLANIVKPFEDERRADFVAGGYRIEPRTRLEQVIGLTTMRGTLDAIDPGTFNPSGRSVAYTKKLWERCGGLPEFIDIDDTLFDHKVRTLRVRWHCALDAIVYWRPRGTFKALAGQFCFYGCGTGHTGIFAESSLYNIRNLLLLFLMTAMGFATLWVWTVIPVFCLYFYIFPFHSRALRVSQTTGRCLDYPLSLLVNWTVLLADALGFSAGSIHRLLNPRRYKSGTLNYLRGEAAPSPNTRRMPEPNVAGAP